MPTGCNTVTSSHSSADISSLDQLTAGAFSAATSGDRAARLRDWLATEPALEPLQEVYREMTARDKGAAKVLKERLDELKRAREQDALTEQWAARAEQLLAGARLNIADALAWQRDAAKAGAPLSREPLASLKTRLAEVVRRVEDLQHQVMVQREAAVLLAQRVEVLSTKPLQEARASREALQADVQAWAAQAAQLMQDDAWASVDMKFAPQLEASRQQLQAVWDGFAAALQQADAALAQADAPLPSVPVWADEIRTLRGEAPVEATTPGSGVSLRELWRRPIGSGFSAIAVVGKRGYTVRTAENGVSSEGLTTTVFPAARAGITFMPIDTSGPFHVMMMPITKPGTSAALVLPGWRVFTPMMIQGTIPVMQPKMNGSPFLFPGVSYFS